MTLILLTALLFSSAQNTWALMGIGELTTSWKEEVTLQSRQVLLVERTVTHGPDEWWRKGRGKIEKQSISFSYKGRNIKWKADGGDWPWSAMPLALDIVGDDPVIVMPVYDMKFCSKYDFPQEGIVALRFHNGRWSRLSIVDLPKDLKINLLQGTHGAKNTPKYKGRTIDADAKRDLERYNNKEYKQDIPISDCIKYFADVKDSCARIRPLPNPRMDAVKQRISDSARDARTVNATVSSAIKGPKTISGKDFRTSVGMWTGNGYLSNSCNGIIKKIEPLLQFYDNNGARRNIGAQLVLSNGEKLQIQYDTAKTRGRDHLSLTTCDSTTIYAIRRQKQDTLLIHRFTHSGEVIDAFFAVLPDTDKISNDKNWGYIWEVTLVDGHLAIALADYSYTQSANLGGTINQKQIYSVTLPR